MLAIKNLKVSYRHGHGEVFAVRGVDLEVPTGGAVALVGESGSGKSTVALSVMRLIRPPVGQIVAGSIELDGVDLLRLDASAMQRVLHADIGYIPQDPAAALDPVCSIGRHIDETLSNKVSGRRRRQAISNLLESLGVVNAGGRLGSYPHEFSGGMLQRVAIATALAREPKLIIADEPTTSLDVTTQLSILRLIDRLRRSNGLSLLFVTHDLSVARSVCQHVVVMYAGHVVERGPIELVMSHPRHPYTRALVESIPRLAAPRSRLRTIAGQPPNLADVPAGCPFSRRCPLVSLQCLKENPALDDDPEVQVACWNAPATTTISP